MCQLARASARQVRQYLDSSAGCRWLRLKSTTARRKLTIRAFGRPHRRALTGASPMARAYRRLC